VTVTKNGASVLLSAGEYVIEEGRGAPPRIGVSVNFYLPTESLTRQPGFYYAFGESMDDHRDQIDCCRFYWSIGPSGAAHLLQVLTGRLNRFRVPFHCKCQRSRAQYQRLDPIVLYLDKRFYQIGVQLIGEAYARVRDHMKPTSPILTKVLAPGLALAEDPPDGESYGMHRCRIVAEGLCDAHDRGITDIDTRLDLIEARFARAGLSLERPYLNPGSIDRYTFNEMPERGGG
jgi:hypothetical protein